MTLSYATYSTNQAKFDFYLAVDWNNLAIAEFEFGNSWNTVIADVEFSNLDVYHFSLSDRFTSILTIT